MKNLTKYFIRCNSIVITYLFVGATKCQKEYLDATASPGMVGQFVPRCAADGSYAPVQCHGSIGFCWCVDRDGKEIPDTRVRGQPKCTVSKSFQLPVTGLLG